MFSKRFLVLACALPTAVLTTGQTLQSIGEVNSFMEDATPRKSAFELTGKVISNFPSPNAGEVILSDEAGTRVEFYRPLKLEQPVPGDTIKARGEVSISQNHEPYVRIDDFSVLARDSTAEPVSVRLSETSARNHHLMSIRTEGVVVDAFPDDVDQRFFILLLKDKDVVVPVSIARDTFGDVRRLVDARIRVTGVYRRSVGGVRKFAWPNITPHAKDDLEILTPPPADPFAVPRLEKRLYLTSEEIALMSKRSAIGEVLASWSGDQAMLRTEDGQIVNLSLANGEPPPPVGETIVAVGQPETDLYRINLTAVRWKTAAEPLPARTNEVAEAGTSGTFWRRDGHHSIKGEAHGRLFSVRGIVRTLPAQGETDLRFVLDTGEVSIPVDVTANASLLDGLAIGSRVQVTGRCILLTEARIQAYSASRVKGFALIVRTPADLIVLSRPSWWTPLRLTTVISVLLAALVGVYIWNRILRNLVQRRGRELYREQVAHAISEFKTGERTRLAVELHDSLSQTLSGVACHLAVGAETLTANPENSKRYLATARKMLNSCRTELRQCLFDLRSDTLEEPDFAVAIRKTLNQIESDAAITVRFNVPRQRLMDTTAHAILSIIRELTGNAIRHGEATEVRVAGCLDSGRLLFSVKDNGRGFDPQHCDGPVQGHFGLEGIRNRLEKIDGTFTIESTPGAGAKASMSIPLPTGPTKES